MSKNNHPRYLQHTIHTNDSLSIMKSTLYFTFYLKSKFWNNTICTEFIPDIYLSLFPEMKKNCTGIRKNPNSPDDNTYIGCQLFGLSYYPRTTNNKLRNHIEYSIMDIFHLPDGIFSKYMGNKTEIDSYINTKLQTFGNPDCIDIGEIPKKPYTGIPLRRSYPIYFPISYDIQRKLQCEYHIQHPTFDMMVTLFNIHLWKSNYEKTTGENIRNCQQFTIDCTYIKTRNLRPSPQYQQKIEIAELELNRQIKEYKWNLSKKYVLHRACLRRNFGYKSM